MLQESTDSKGPRLPTSIHSTWDSIKTQVTTLMRSEVDHGIHEFSDLRCHDRRVSSDDVSAMPDDSYLTGIPSSSLVLQDARALQGARARIRNIR